MFLEQTMREVATKFPVCFLDVFRDPEDNYSCFITRAAKNKNVFFARHADVNQVTYLDAKQHILNVFQTLQKFF